MILTIDNVSKRFENKRVLHDIQLDLTPGVYGILGANGSGKTTLMRIVAGVMKPSSGTIFFNGKNIEGLDGQYRDLIGYLPQHVGFYKHFSAEKFLHYISSLKGIEKNEAKEKVEEVLELVGLTGHKKEKIGSFSGGMKRRIGIAQALLNDPKILIVDEPTAGLDPKERIRFRNLLSKISGERIVLLSTHIVSDIEFIAKEILILKEGRLLKRGIPQLLLQEIEGKVWTMEVEERELDELQNMYKVGNITRNQDCFHLRILSDAKPDVRAKEETPNLEDLYLFYFDREATRWNW